MDPHLTRVYLSYVDDQCRFYLHSIENLNNLFISDNLNPEDVFLNLQSAIRHAAAVSRVFWPAKTQRKFQDRSHNRGEALRQALKIPNTHPAQARTLRDHLDHFEERLDDWAENSPHRNIVNNLIGPRESIGGNAITDTDILNHYDPELKCYIFRGQKYDIQLLTNGIIDIKQKIHQYYQQQ